MIPMLDWLKALLRPKKEPEPPGFGGAGATESWVDIDLMRAVAPDADDETLLRFLGPLNATCGQFDITTSQRMAAFLAQVAHESGGFRYVREIASGAAYEGRLDLGNTEPGDGELFAGRGLIQLTGRSNYRSASFARYGDERLLLAPQLLERPDLAAWVAGWYWHSRDLNALADVGDFQTITRRINGGLNGQADRERRWKAAKAELGIA